MQKSNTIWSPFGKLPKEAKEIREAVFVDEQGFNEEFDETDENSYHLLLEKEGNICGTARMFAEPDGSMHVGRVALKKEARGTGAGRALLEACCAKAQALGAPRIILGAQMRAKGFYEKSGFAAYGEPFDDEGCPHIMMEYKLTGRQQP